MRMRWYEGSWKRVAASGWEKMHFTTVNAWSWAEAMGLIAGFAKYGLGPGETIKDLRVKELNR